MSTIREAIASGGEKLAELGFDNPLVEVEAILGGLLGVSPSHLHLNAGQPFPKDVERMFFQLLERRVQHEPVAYLLGRKNFFGRDFKVNPSVLIPRPETELLVENLLQGIRQSKGEKAAILEIGTGSGCIAITLACEIKGVEIVATDISDSALAAADFNAETHSVGPKIHFLRSDLFSNLGPHFKRYFDIIVSNPPYISSLILDQLDQEVRFEPRLALDGGKEGLSFLRLIIQQAPAYLKPRGRIALEIGFDQGLSVSRILGESGFTDVVVNKDLDHRDRFATGRLGGSI